MRKHAWQLSADHCVRCGLSGHEVVGKDIRACKPSLLAWISFWAWAWCNHLRLRSSLSHSKPRKGALAEIVETTLKCKQGMIVSQYPGFIPDLPPTLANEIATEAIELGLMAGPKSDLLDFLADKIRPWEQGELSRAKTQQAVT